MSAADDIAYKLEGARYHAEQVGILHQLATEAKWDPEKPHRLVGNQLFWEFEACLFQLAAAFDFALQDLSIRRGLDLKPNQVRWETVVRLLPDDQFVQDLKVARDDHWFRAMTSARNDASHRNSPAFEFAVVDDHIAAIAYNGIPLPSLLDDWLEHARSSFRAATGSLRQG